jgi:hypothetical protein
MNMSEITFEGKTHAEWLAIRGKHVVLGPNEAKKEEALLWFENEEKKARHETEERRFQAQLTEARQQASASRKIAWSAVAVSVVSVLVAVGSLVVAIFALVRSSQSQPPVLPLSQPASIAAPQATNAAPSTLTNTTKP